MEEVTGLTGAALLLYLLLSEGSRATIHDCLGHAGVPLDRLNAPVPPPRAGSGS